jgi:5-methylthioadenosine/S-adenosylhomocysteine deaminase
LQKLGVAMGLGTDADVKPSIVDEMRAASLLQKVSRLDGSALGARTAFALGTSQGAAALRVEAGALREGRFADYAVIDADGVDGWTPLVNALVYRAENGWVRETYVGGRCVRTRDQSAPAAAVSAMRSLLPRLAL